jgi:hypothetical protein
VEVRFGEEFSGQPLPAEHHQAMEALWSAKTALNPLFFNGLKVPTPSRYSRVRHIQLTGPRPQQFRCAAHGPTGTTADGPRLRFDVGTRCVCVCACVR